MLEYADVEMTVMEENVCAHRAWRQEARHPVGAAGGEGRWAEALGSQEGGGEASRAALRGLFDRLCRLWGVGWPLLT